MATMVEDLAIVFLPAQGNLLNSAPLVFGTNLYVGLLPNTPDPVAGLFEYPGAEPERVMGPTAAKGALTHPRAQIMVRVDEKSYLIGRNGIEAITQALEKANTVINGTLYQRIERLQEPFFLHRDTSRRLYFACNFAMTRAEV